MVEKDPGQGVGNAANADLVFSDLRWGSQVSVSSVGTVDPSHSGMGVLVPPSSGNLDLNPGPTTQHTPHGVLTLPCLVLNQGGMVSSAQGPLGTILYFFLVHLVKVNWRPFWGGGRI